VVGVVVDSPPGSTVVVVRSPRGGRRVEVGPGSVLLVDDGVVLLVDDVDVDVLSGEILLVSR
jgi:hypothetical protein